ncbi:hypothetical protein POVWA2_040350 [Plasmodium ovale wallikeri]|uniref:Uncharacterized protein n=1 Tax=Plasmodium ovale wallikeri TaxID=864142 RepID=A0A1A8Z8U8_PLAOA|nr:hypothetical protein POVWA1_041790 [Plasmodium ovale wallikeri]SBT40716.1 hypothetical protein POVWA2_040350 [Plasmodium ovale wallikeri]
MGEIYVGKKLRRIMPSFFAPSKFEQCRVRTFTGWDLSKWGGNMKKKKKSVASKYALLQSEPYCKVSSTAKQALLQSKLYCKASSTAKREHSTQARSDAKMRVS